MQDLQLQAEQPIGARNLLTDRKHRVKGGFWLSKRADNAKGYKDFKNFKDFKDLKDLKNSWTPELLE